MSGYKGYFVVLLAIGLVNSQQPYRRQLQSRQPYPEVEELSRPKVYEVQHQISPNQGDGSFRYYSATSDGLESAQDGHFNKPHNSQVHQGSYTTTDEHGQVVRINYVADKDGFRPIGENGAPILPTSPPVPVELVQATKDILEQQRAIREQHLGYARAGYLNANAAYANIANAHAEIADAQANNAYAI